MNCAVENIQYLKKVEKQLSGVAGRASRFEAEGLIFHYGRLTRLQFLTGQKEIGARPRQSVEKALQIRNAGTPLAYILKEAHFYGRRFAVNRRVLIPRPETELLLEEALRILAEHFPLSRGLKPEILDIGTGSGCLAVSLTMERPDCRMTALDLSPSALRVARRNAEFHGVRDKVRILKSDLFGSIEKSGTSFWDLVITNPPYIPQDEMAGLPREVRVEPRRALDGGRRGLELIDTILQQAPAFLKSGGWLLMEIGKGQARPIEKQILKRKQFESVRWIKELRGIDRILVARNG